MSDGSLRRERGFEGGGNERENFGRTNKRRCLCLLSKNKNKKSNPLTYFRDVKVTNIPEESHETVR